MTTAKTKVFIELLLELKLLLSGGDELLLGGRSLPRGRIFPGGWMSKF